MLKGSSISSRLIFGFLAIALLVAGVSIFSFRELRKVEGPLRADIPRALTEIETTSRLDSLATKIRLYDQILTEAAREYVSTGDRQWKFRYKDFEPKLDAAIKEAIHRGDHEDESLFSELQKAKLVFVHVELQALGYVGQGQQEEAAQVLESLDYWNAKREYKKILEEYAERRNQKFDDTFQVTAKNVESIVQATRKTVRDSINLLSILSGLALVLAIALGIFIARSILNPLRSLQQGTEIVGKGNLDHRIETNSKDEVGQLARAFNEMSLKLKNSYAGLEGKVRERTKELGDALEDLEKAKSQIEEEKAKDEAILASIGEGMIATDREGKIMMMNKQAGLMLDLRERDVVGKVFGDVIRNQNDKGEPITGEQSPLYNSLSTGKKIVATAYYERKDRTKFPAATTVSPIVRDGKTVGAIGIFRDITHEKEVDRMKTEFISTVSHELRTPLTVIREGVSLVMDNILGPTTEEQQNFLNLALSDIDRLARIINNLLDVAKIEAGKMGLKRERTDVNELVRDVVSTFKASAEGKGLKIRPKVPAEKLELYIDRDKIIQAFTNIIGNSLKFTEKGHIDVYIEDKGECLECGISDTGRGMSEQDLAKLFSKFQQFGRTDGGGEKGTGLGLSIAKGIVELHQGKIWVESELDKGTSFKFQIPKYSPKELFRGYVVRGLRDAVNQGSSLSVFSFGVKDWENVRRDLGSNKSPEVVEYLEDAVKAHLKNREDQTVTDDNAVLMVLPAIEKKKAEFVAADVKKSFADILAKHGFNGNIQMDYRLASYPDDGSTEEDLLCIVRGT
ncbi:MAG: ATP-binding protein [Candidatus Omnitrophota bacterium]|nr:ATP-binding protein [Candidatus Omnitrophota bacterium]